MASRRNFLKFQFLGNRERVTELSGPLHVGQWTLHHCLEKNRFGDQIMGTGPFELKFRIFDLVATSCTLAYIFPCILTEGIMLHDVYKAGKIHFKMTPKIGGSKIFGGVALFEFAPFGG